MKSRLIVVPLSSWVLLLSIPGEVLAQTGDNIFSHNNRAFTDEPTTFPTTEPEPTNSPTIRTIYLNNNGLQVYPQPVVTQTPNYAPIDPAPLPTTVPPTTDDASSPTLCFPADATVMIKSKGKFTMKELQLGDVVYVGNGKYEEVYSFGHYDPDVAVTNYLEIHAARNNSNKKILHISPDHMIYSESLLSFVPSSSLIVGDHVLMDDDDSFGKVVMEIHSIKSDVPAIGAYAPFTASGQIVVNSIVASTYISLLQEEEKSFVSHQWLAHSFEFPHRFICRFVGCEETYDKDGVSNWVSLPLKIFQFLLKSKWKNIVLFTFVIPLFVFFTWMEYVLSPLGIAIILISTTITSGIPTRVSIKYRHKAPLYKE